MDHLNMLLKATHTETKAPNAPIQPLYNNTNN